MEGVKTNASVSGEDSCCYCNRSEDLFNGYVGAHGEVAKIFKEIKSGTKSYSSILPQLVVNILNECLRHKNKNLILTTTKSPRDYCTDCNNAFISIEQLCKSMLALTAQEKLESPTKIFGEIEAYSEVPSYIIYLFYEVFAHKLDIQELE